MAKEQKTEEQKTDRDKQVDFWERVSGRNREATEKSVERAVTGRNDRDY